MLMRVALLLTYLGLQYTTLSEGPFAPRPFYNCFWSWWNPRCNFLVLFLQYPAGVLLSAMFCLTMSGLEPKIAWP